MGASDQIIVFPFFGERYLKQFKVCLQTIPKHWTVAVITDQDFEDERCIVYRVESPGSAYECLTYRKRIPEFVEISLFDRVWHCDMDVLFTGDLLAKYSDPIYDRFVIVTEEPMTRIDNEHMGKGFSQEYLTELILNRAPAINGGLIGVPKSEAKFWTMYKDYIDVFHDKMPDVMSCDQQVLNLMYHSRRCLFALADKEDIGFPTRGVKGKLMNHYIGYDANKHEMMEKDLNK